MKPVWYSVINLGRQFLNLFAISFVNNLASVLIKDKGRQLDSRVASPFLKSRVILVFIQEFGICPFIASFIVSVSSTMDLGWVAISFLYSSKGIPSMPGLLPIGVLLIRCSMVSMSIVSIRLFASGPERQHVGGIAVSMLFKA